MVDELVSAEGEKSHEFVIVGAGIGGLATALALHRKGFKDVVVYERSEILRVEGAAIGIFSNGWRALDQLGVGDQLRDKAILMEGDEDVWIKNGRSRKSQYLDGEARCLKRRDLIDALDNALPPNTIRFGRKAAAVKMDPQSMSPALQLDDGKAVRAQVLIGCDGSNSKVAEFIGLKPASSFALAEVRGLTNYQNGHSFPPVFVRMRGDQENASLVGRIPINDKLIYWFVAIHLPWQAQKFPDDPELIKQATLKRITGFPADVGEMIENWQLVVNHKNIEEAFAEYVKERRMRIMRLPTQTYLFGVILGSTSSVIKFIAIVTVIFVFRNRRAHTKYDCGKL